MSRCQCGHGAAPNAIEAAVVTADTTVEELTRRPGALEVLQRFRLNHCCGAKLTLRESAASAGARVEDVLEALGSAGIRG